MSRQDLLLITASAQTAVGGPMVSLGTFERRSGGAVSATDVKFRPGGSPTETSLGGSRTTENVTISRVFDLDRDNELLKRLASVVGQAKVTVSQQPMTADYVPRGTPTIWSGILIKATPPEADSGGNATSMMELEVSTSGSIG